MRAKPTTVTRAARLAPWLDRFADAYIESYVAWREECDGLRGAYQRWASSRRLDRDLAFLAYRAALEREAQAAHVYELRGEELHRRGNT